MKIYLKPTKEERISLQLENLILAKLHTYDHIADLKMRLKEQEDYLQEIEVKIKYLQSIPLNEYNKGG